MKKKPAKLKRESLTPLQRAGVVKILREAAERAAAEPVVRDAEADRDLLEAALRAQRECEGFTQGYKSVQAITGVLEMMRHLIVSHNGCPPDRVDWSSIADVLDEAHARAGNLYAAFGHLEQFERNHEVANA
jgi:hypothetical protein